MTEEEQGSQEGKVEKSRVWGVSYKALPLKQHFDLFNIFCHAFDSPLPPGKSAWLEVT